MNHRRARASNWFSRRLGVFVLALALLTAFYMLVNSYQGRQSTRCQVEYNQAVSVSVKERSAYADQDRESLVTFIREISAAKNRAQSKEILDRYLKRQEEISWARQQHPIPELPAGKCS